MNETIFTVLKIGFRELNFKNKILFAALAIVHYVKKNILHENIKEWTYLNLVVACVLSIFSLWLFITSFAFLLESGFLWVVTLGASVFLFKMGNRDTTYGEDKFLYKITSGMCILVSIIIFLAMF